VPLCRGLAPGAGTSAGHSFAAFIIDGLALHAEGLVSLAEGLALLAEGLALLAHAQRGMSKLRASAN
jgi:hypothetical protein